MQRLHGSVLHRRYREGSFLSVLFGNVDSPQGLRFVATSAQAACSPPFGSGALPQSAVNAGGVLPLVGGHPFHSQ